MPPDAVTSGRWPGPAEIKARLARERARLGLTQREAAAALGVSQSTYQQYESGRGYPTFPTVFGLIDLGMDPRAILPELFGRP